MLDPLGVALDQRSLGRCFVIRRVGLQRAQVVVLVLERVRELVDKRRPQRRREGAIGNEDPFALGVVEGSDPFSGNRVELIEEIDVPVQQTQGAQDGLRCLQLAPILRVDIGRLRRELITELLGREEVNRHRMFEGQPALRFHEPDQVLHARVPRIWRWLGWSFIPASDAGNDDSRSDDEGEQDADDRPSRPSSGRRLRRPRSLWCGDDASGRLGRRQCGRSRCVASCP
jgi:hypothetical protein